MAITFRDFIVRSPEKMHSIALEILYRTRFFRVSGDKITKSYDHLKILYKKYSIHFSCSQLRSVPGLAGIDRFPIHEMDLFLNDIRDDAPVTRNGKYENEIFFTES